MAKREKYTTGKDGYKRYQVTYVDAAGCTCRKRLTARTDHEMDEKIKQFNRSIGRGTVGFDTSTLLSAWSVYWLEASKSSSVDRGRTPRARQRYRENAFGQNALGRQGDP